MIDQELNWRRAMRNWAPIQWPLICPLILWIALALNGNGQEAELDPIVHLDAGGHTSRVMSVCFNSTGEELWSAGWDKTVRLWKKGDNGQWVAQPNQTIYVPLGPGRNGVIDNIALSANDRWLAIGGYSRISSAAKFSEHGVERALSAEQLLDQGTIYIYDRHGQTLQRLQGHRGPVRRLVFDHHTDTPQLASAGYESHYKDSQLSIGGGMRLWDVVQSRQLSALEALPRPTDPTLAFLSPAAGTRLAANWGDGKLVLWDTKNSISVSVGNGSQLLAHSQLGKWAVTGSVDRQSAGQLTFWDMSQAETPRPLTARQTTLATEVKGNGNAHFLPLTGLVFTNAEPQKEYLALIALVWKPSPARGPSQALGYQLRTLELPAADQPAREVSRFDLWSASGDAGLGMPSVACSGAANTLAVANGSDGHIVTFQLDELIAGRATQQVLSNRLVQLQQTNFAVRKTEAGDRLGLRIQGAAQEPFVLDITTNELVQSELNAWQSSDAQLAGWQVQPVTVAGRGSSTPDWSIVSGAQRRALQLPAEVSYRQSLFIPSTIASQPPWLMVAGEEQGQPWLGLFSASSGELVRLLTGHTNRIVHLAAARDGRFAASTSADQTVALWDLSRPSEITSPHATLRGIALSDARDGVTVENAAASSGLVAGDRILGLVEPQIYRAWSNSKELYDAIWDRQPGSEIVVRIARGAERREMKLALARAIGERKPMCQLMFIQADGKPQWVAWTPLGYYDLSSLDNRRHFGWLFNPSAPAERVNFVAADKYPKLFIPRLLNELWSEPQQDLSKFSLRQGTPRFELTIPRPAAVGTASDGNEIVDAQPAEFYLALTNEFPTEYLDPPQLFLDGQALGNMAEQGEAAWRGVARALETLEPGIHRLQAKIAAPRLSRDFTAELNFHFIPPPPELKLAGEIPLHTKEDSARLVAEIRSAMPHLPAEVVLERLDEAGQPTQLKRWPTATNQTVSESLELAIGVNRFRLLADYARPVDKASAVTSPAQHLLTIERHPLDTSPPEYADLLVEAAEAQWPEPQPPTGNRSAYRCPYDSIVIRGKIKATELLAAAKLGDTMLDGFASGTKDAFVFTQLAKLKPGLNRIVFAAATIAGGESKHELLVEYQPQLPQVEIDFPPRNYEVSELQARPQIKLLGRLQWPQFAQAAKVAVSVNGQTLATQTMSHDSSSLPEIWLPLQVGDNRCQIQLTGAIDGRQTTRVLHYRYLPTPKLIAIAVPQTTRETRFQIVANGEAATEIQRVTLDDRDVPRESWQATWQDSKFNLQVDALIDGEDGQRRTLAIYSQGVPSPATRQFAQPLNLGPIKPPRLVWLSPSEDTALTSATASVRFEVRSTEPLTRLTFNDQDMLSAKPLTATPGVQVFESTVKILPGANALRLVAENEGGSDSNELVLQRLLPPGYVESVWIEMADKSRVKPTTSHEAEWRFAKPLSTGHNMDLHFSVLTDEAAETWIAVNGYRRRAIAEPTTEPHGRVHYRCPIVLVQPRDNFIEIQFGLPTAQASRTVVKLDCLSPAKPKRRMHLALVGIGVKDEQEFIESAVSSFAGKSLRQTDARLYEFEANLYERCFAYGPYAGSEISRGVINYVLTNDIPNNISRQANDPLVQDVVMFYYRGGEQVFDGGEFYLTTQAQNPALDEIMRGSKWLKNRGIGSNYLSSVMNELQGAHVMMLDVARMNGEPADATPVISSFAPHAATYRFAWTGPKNPPVDATLMTAWREAYPRADNLGEIESELGQEHAAASSRYRGAIRYEHKTPIVLRNVVLRQ